MLSTQSADGTAPDNSPARAGIRQSSSASDRKYPYLVHRRHGLGIERGRLHARAQHLEALPAISRRKASAICVRLLLSEQRKRTLGFTGLFAERHNGRGSHGLVAGAAFGIEEAQQLLQGVRIGPVCDTSDSSRPLFVRTEAFHRIRRRCELIRQSLSKDRRPPRPVRLNLSYGIDLTDGIRNADQEAHAVD
jgi:hypothetical protein